MKASALFDADPELLLSMDSLSFNSAALLKFAGDLSFDKEFSDGYIEDDAALFYTMIGELSLSLRLVLKVEWSF